MQIDGINNIVKVLPQNNEVKNNTLSFRGNDSNFRYMPTYTSSHILENQRLGGILEKMEKNPSNINSKDMQFFEQVAETKPGLIKIKLFNMNKTNLTAFLDNASNIIKDKPNLANFFISTLNQDNNGINDSNNEVKIASLKLIKEIGKAHPDQAKPIIKLLTSSNRGLKDDNYKARMISMNILNEISKMDSSYNKEISLKLIPKNSQEIFQELPIPNNINMHEFINNIKDLINTVNKGTILDKNIEMRALSQSYLKETILNNPEENRDIIKKLLKSDNEIAKMFLDIGKDSPKAAEIIFDEITDPETGIDNLNPQKQLNSALILSQLIKCNDKLPKKLFNILTKPNKYINDQDNLVKIPSMLLLSQIPQANSDMASEILDIIAQQKPSYLDIENNSNINSIDDLFDQENKNALKYGAYTLSLGEIAKANPKYAQECFNKLTKENEGINSNNIITKATSILALSQVAKAEPKMANDIYNLLTNNNNMGINSDNEIIKTLSIISLTLVAQANPKFAQDVYNLVNQASNDNIINVPNFNLANHIGLGFNTSDITPSSVKQGIYNIALGELVKAKPVLAQQVFTKLTDNDKGINSNNGILKHSALLALSQVAKAEPKMAKDAFSASKESLNILTQMEISQYMKADPTLFKDIIDTLKEPENNDIFANERKQANDSILLNVKNYGLQSPMKSSLAKDIRKTFKEKNLWNDEGLKEQQYKEKSDVIFQLMELYKQTITNENPDNSESKATLPKEVIRHIGSYIHPIPDDVYDGIEEAMEKVSTDRINDHYKS